MDLSLAKMLVAAMRDNENRPMKPTAMISLALWSLFMSASAGELTNVISSRILDRSLEEVRAAVQASCSTTNSPAWCVKVDEVPGISFKQWIVDCTPPPPVSHLTGALVATKLTDRTTRLEVFCQLANGQFESRSNLAVVGRKYQERIASHFERRK